MTTYKDFLENNGEKRWQTFWEENKTFSTPEDVTPENKCYILPQLPYPSGSGLHVGHAVIYVSCDIYARYQRMKGKKVLQVFGLDSFGLPAENYAIKTNVHPKQTIDETGANFMDQVKKLGASVDWDRFVRSSDPGYYKFTQWFFLLMYERGLAYRKKQAVNWCESCKTVLANAQVEDGHCERCDTDVVQKDMEQWYLKITDYADKLLEGLDRIDWPAETIKRQKDWIGKSEGAEIVFPVRHSERSSDEVRSEVEESRDINEDPCLPAGRSPLASGLGRDDVSITVFTTRPDTLFGATYMVLAPEGQYVQDLKDQITNWDEVQAYIDETAKKTDLDRQVNQEKTGVELKGIKAVNPANGEEIPVWIADYVIATYGTGAIMAVPAHDERDFAFAKKFGLEIREVAIKQLRDRFEKDDPRHSVYGICIKDNKVLTVFNNADGEYQFPGGGLEKGESIDTAFVREIQEETGYLNFSVIERYGSFESSYYLPSKDLNRRVTATIYSYELIDDSAIARPEKEQEELTVEWIPLEEIQKIFDGPRYGHVLKEAFERVVKETQILYTDYGVSINSDFLNGLTTEEAKSAMIDWLEKEGKGKRKIQYKLRDWSVSRQRFWGAPLPMLVNEETGEVKPVPFEDLPVLLPEDVDFKPTGQSPLTYSKTFQEGVEETYGAGWKREVNTLDTFMCSSWYFFRYLDPNNENEFASPEALKNWMPVDFYLGGPEHVNGHLLYARFFTKVLFDAGYIDFDEPFTVHRHQGLIKGPDGRKMSKRWGNVINPTDVVDEYGADTMRMYEMFMGPLEEDKPWDENGVKGVRRFLDRVWKLQERVSSETSENINAELERQLHLTIKKVGDDLDTLGFNTAIAKMMELVNSFYKEETVSVTHYSLLITLLAPFAPHMAEELWQILGNKDELAFAEWPAYDESKLVSDTLKIAVQVNGKVRATIEVATDASEEDVKATALAEENVAKWLEGGEPKKVIYVKGKIVNVVV